MGEADERRTWIAGCRWLATPQPASACLPPLPWLLACLFRRRVVLDGVINCTEGWREKVAALAERRAASSHAGAVTAASVWRHRVQRLAQAQPASGQGAGTAQGPDAGAEAAAGMLPSTGGGDGGDALCGAISAGEPGACLLVHCPTPVRWIP